MKKILVLFCFAFMSVLLFAQAEYVVCYDNVKVHTTTELNGPTSGELRKNDVVKVLNTSGEWAVIDYEGSVGYVLKYFLKFVREEKVAVDTVPTPKDVVQQDTIKQDTVTPPDTANVKAPVDSSLIIAYSRTQKAKSFFGFSVNYSMLEAKDNAEGGFPAYLHGITAGFVGHSVIYKHIVILSGISYQFGTAQLNQRAMNESWYCHSIKVPLKIGLSIPFAKKSALSLYFGPSFDFNISTKRIIANNTDYQTNIDYINGKYESIINDKLSSGQKLDYKVLGFFDVPIGFGAIYQYGHVGLKFEYEWGMLNRYGNKYKNEYSLKINQLSAGLIVTF